MSNKIQKLLKPMIYVAVFVFIICCIIKKPVKFTDCITYISYSVTVDIFLFLIYEKWFWKCFPGNRSKVLKKNYDGMIFYNYNGRAGEKSIKITIKQSLFNIIIHTETDINSSITTSAVIVREHEEDVLYYTYLTNPSAMSLENNPIQYGTCRMVLKGNNNVIKGKYWTTSHTVGDMKWITTD